MHDCGKLFREAYRRHPRPYVAGLDLSLTSSGFYLRSLSPDGDDYFYHIETTSKDGTDTARIDYVADTLLHDLLLPEYPVITVAIEDYGQVNARAGKLMVRAELCGIVKRELRAAGIPYYTVSPNGLKKYATGYGGTRKGEKLKEAVIIAANNDGFVTTVSDEADSYWLAKLAESIVRDEPHEIDIRRVNPL